ncbi:MAG: hypothetical protein EPO07_08070 [Verrucomicrobia bacterium]|nr:MAG: hypothetical protein EPO07_08070 [Verrucomicrobiota bacterium]
MKRTKFGDDRHKTLWAEQSDSVGKWILGALTFALLLQLRVLAPYIGLSSHRTTVTTALAETTNRLAEARAKLLVSSNILVRVSEIATATAKQPWLSQAEDLKKSMWQIQQNYERVLKDQSFLQEKLELQKKPEGVSGGTTDSPLQFQANGIARPEDVRARRVAPDMAANGVSPALQGVRPGMAAPDPRIVAAWDLKLDPNVIKGLSADQYVRVVNEQAVKQCQERADQTITDVATAVDLAVIKPLQDLADGLRGTNDLAVPLTQSADKMRGIVAQWKDKHLGDSKWWESRHSKDDKIQSFTNDLRKSSDDLARELKAHEKAVEQKQAELADSATAAEHEQTELKARTEKLDSELQSLLPEWLRGLLGVEKMLQLYPLALLLLLGVIGVKVALVRYHFSFVKAANELDSESLRDPATSSLWTLTYRGQWTWLSGLILGVVSGLLWFMFATGCAQTLASLVWLPEEQRLFVAAVVKPISLAGHAAFLGATVGLVIVLVKEWGARGQPSPARRP